MNVSARFHVGKCFALMLFFAAVFVFLGAAEVLAESAEKAQWKIEKILAGKAFGQNPA